ncbi:MAG TPA: hypothetical protein VJV23_06385 [Candidatus Polarisedimenticolia bacterium]|nr:hypothetical protein [Candidatus Polarisedimenticolia bacterium]
MPARPRAFEESPVWCLTGIPPVHPARKCAIFVVHGMGTQVYASTAAELRAGFEDALERIERWQRRHEQRTGTVLPPEVRAEQAPPPFILDGFWADYPDLSTTFAKEWSSFNDREKSFFSMLWKTRVFNGPRTALWFIRQQLRLIHPRTLWEVGPLAWLLYLPLQVIMPLFLTLALLRRPGLVTEVLGDVRLYVAPKGAIERAIVHRIDQRVGEAFLKMIGLGWDFLPLQGAARLDAAGQPIEFDRVVWVAHSLGTVISHNVLSDLLHRAGELERSGTRAQQDGVRRFRASLRRFVTMGSPLDKIAFLFGARTLRPWPGGPRKELFPGGESLEANQRSEDREWWVNFYSVFDPVSGALSNPLICGDEPPANLHIGFFHLPGVAHVGYWKDGIPLRYILGRTYGKDVLFDQETRVWPAWLLTLMAMVSYVVWGGLLFGLTYGVVEYGPAMVVRWVRGALAHAGL